MDGVAAQLAIIQPYHILSLVPPYLDILKGIVSYQTIVQHLIGQFRICIAVDLGGILGFYGNRLWHDRNADLLGNGGVVIPLRYGDSDDSHTLIMNGHGAVNGNGNNILIAALIRHGSGGGFCSERERCIAVGLSIAQDGDFQIARNLLYRNIHRLGIAIIVGGLGNLYGDGCGSGLVECHVTIYIHSQDAGIAAFIGQRTIAVFGYFQREISIAVILFGNGGHTQVWIRALHVEALVSRSSQVVIPGICTCQSGTHHITSGIGRNSRGIDERLPAI